MELKLEQGIGLDDVTIKVDNIQEGIELLEKIAKNKIIKDLKEIDKVLEKCDELQKTLIEKNEKQEQKQNKENCTCGNSKKESENKEIIYVPCPQYPQYPRWWDYQPIWKVETPYWNPFYTICSTTYKIE